MNTQFTFPKHSAISIIAPRGCGKSNLVKDIIKNITISKALLISSYTEKVCPTYNNTDKLKDNIKYEYDANDVAQFINDPVENKLLVIDDCIGYKKNCDILENAIKTCKDNNTFIIIVSQYPISFVRHIAKHIDYFMFGKENFENTKMALYRLCDSCTNSEQFIKDLDENTEDYGFFTVCNDSEQSIEPFKYKAQLNL